MPNTFLNMAKWPLIAVSLVLAWFCAMQLPTQALALAERTSIWMPTVLGMSTYALIWKPWLSENRTIAWVYVFEHELGHAIGALLTFNGVHQFHADQSGVGHISVPNSDNWVMLVMPYVLPTAIIIPSLLILSVLPGFYGYFVFGVALSFHIHSTLRETHRNQSDLMKLGRPASLLFLPACHVVILTLTFGFLLDRNCGIHTAWGQTRAAISQLSFVGLI